MRVAGGALDRDGGELFPIEVEAAFRVLKRREDDPADSAGGEHAAEAGGCHAVLAGPQVLQLVTVGASAGRDAGEQALGARLPQPLFARRPVRNERDDGKIAAHAQLLPVSGKGAAGGIWRVVELECGAFHSGDCGGGQRGVVAQGHRHGSDAEADVVGDVLEGRGGRGVHLSDSVDAVLFCTARPDTPWSHVPWRWHSAP